MAVPANLVDKLIAIVKENVGRPGDTTLDDYVIEWINWALKKIENKANFYWMHKTTELSYVQSDLSKALPSDFKDEDSVWLKDAATSTFSEIEPMDWEDYRKRHDDVFEASPSVYLIDADNTLILRPVPDDSYTIKLEYWGYSDALVAGGAQTHKCLVNHPEVLETGATYRAFRKFSEMEDAATWKNEFADNLRDLVVYNADRELPDEMEIKPRTDARGDTLSEISRRIE